MEVLSFSHLVSGKYSDIPFDLTIGVFDGMHRGHRKIIDALLDTAKKDFASSLIITFDRNPKRKGLPFLDSENMRLEKFRSTGVDFLAVIDFSPDFAKMSALEFASLLSENLYLKRLVVGRDFKCGCPSRQLDGKGLAEAVSKPGMDVQVTFVDYLMLPDGESPVAKHWRFVIYSPERVEIHMDDDLIVDVGITVFKGKLHPVAKR